MIQSTGSMLNQNSYSSILKLINAQWVILQFGYVENITYILSLTFNFEFEFDLQPSPSVWTHSQALQNVLNLYLIA